MSIRKAYAVFFAWISGTFTTAAVAVLDGNYAMPYRKVSSTRLSHWAV